MKRGVLSRRSKQPVRRDEVEAVNAALLKLEYKIPGLVDEAFLGSLAQPSAGSTAEAARTPTPAAGSISAADLAVLRDRFINLGDRTNRQEAGYMLESLLNELFTLAGLSPRAAFRVTGEQIDGSFDLDREIYLLEAKWQKVPAGLGDLATLRVKVEGKSAWTRGLFLSIEGFSPDGVEGLVRGKQQNCVLMDGADLFRVLNGDFELPELLRRKARLLAETGRPYIPVSQLLE